MMSGMADNIDTLVEPNPGSGPATITLGADVEHGQLPQALVPGGHWQCARPAAGQEVLVSCVVSPGFDCRPESGPQ